MTRRDCVAGLGVLVVSAIVTACGGSTAASVAGNDAGVCGGQTGVSAARSQNYVVVLVATTRIATHLELHICSRSTGAVVTGLHPEVTLRNVSAGEQPVALPVAVLQDAGQGVNGTAYGNNVMLTGNQTYALDVKIAGSDAVSLTYETPVTGPKRSPQPGCLQNHQLC